MIEKKSPFFAYRYLVTPTSPQTTIMQSISPSKEDLMRHLIVALSENTKTEWSKGKKRFLFYGIQNDENINIIKFARETDEKIYVEGDDDIEISNIKEAKFVLLIIDTENQIILLERNVSVFQSIDNAVNILAQYFRSNMLQYDYVVNIYPLSANKKFWNYVEQADEIYELSLEMNAPNMAFFGHEDTRNILSIIKEATNNEEFDISLKNKEGDLKIDRDLLGSWIDYVREVGGKYLLKLKINGQIETKSSKTDIAKVYIEKKKNGLYSEEELKKISTQLELTNKLENRNNEDEET